MGVPYLHLWPGARFTLQCPSWHVLGEFLQACLWHPNCPPAQDHHM